MKRSKAFLGGLAALAVGGFLIFLGFKEYRNSKRLVKDGKAVVAKVTDKDMTTGRKGRRSYYMNVEFKTEAGQQVDERLKVSSSDYDSAPVGGNVQVHYLPDDPTICQVGNQAQVKWTTFVIGAFMTLVGGFGLFRSRGSEESHQAEHAEKQPAETADAPESAEATQTADASSSDDSYEEAA